MCSNITHTKTHTCLYFQKSKTVQSPRCTSLFLLPKILAGPFMKSWSQEEMQSRHLLTPRNAIKAPLTPTRHAIKAPPDDLWLTQLLVPADWWPPPASPRAHRATAACTSPHLALGPQSTAHHKAQNSQQSSRQTITKQSPKLTITKQSSKLPITKHKTVI